MSKIIYVVELHEYDITTDKYISWADKAFLTRSAAENYVDSIHPKARAVGYEYTCPDDGVKVWRTYWVTCLVLEEE